MSLTIWQNLCAELKASLEKDDFKLWIEPLRPLDGPEGRLVIGCPDNFHRKWIKDHYLPRLRRLAREQIKGIDLSLAVFKGNGAQRPRLPRQMSLPGTAFEQPVLNQGFVFKRFITGRSNEFAWAAARSLAQDQKVFANTLFLFSGTGLGKSHLTQAVGNLVLNQAPEQRVAYLTAEDFTNQMISSLRKKRIEEFKDRFRRHCDILLLEEVQFLAGKEKTQDELSYTLDALLNAGKRIIFTGSSLPAQIKGLKKGLKSRLCAGITAPIEPPDPQTRRGILLAMAREEGIEVDSEVLDYLSSEINGDVRRLQSALVGLMAKSSLTGRSLDLKMAAEVLGNMDLGKRRVTPEEILEVVAKLYALDRAVLTGKSRKKDIVRPRNLAMYTCRRHTEASYASIGQLFNRDHATVMYGVDQVERKLARDTKLAQELAYIEEKIGPAPA